MASEFLASYGVDLQAVMDSAHKSSLSVETPDGEQPPSTPGVSKAANSSASQLPTPTPVSVLRHVLLDTANDDPHDIHVSPEGVITAITPSASPATSLSPYAHTLALPSLAHPHLHLDKAHLLTHPDTCHLQPEKGTFAEALALTSQTKFHYTPASLDERMNALIADALPRSGATHARVFVEVDVVVELKALEAGLRAKEAWREHCELQVCAFAQEAVMGAMAERNTLAIRKIENRRLMERAVKMAGVECLGATPYVEDSAEAERMCVEWAVRTALAVGVHLDLHLDYHLDAGKEALVWFVLEVLRRERWAEKAPGKTVCLGHCTRFMLFTAEEWRRLKREVEGLPVYFVGLPTSDLFMMGRPPVESGAEEEQQQEGEKEAAAAAAAAAAAKPPTPLLLLQDRPRGTLQIPAMISYGLRATIGANNAGNAFTPYGTADPLELARWGVGLYQASTAAAAGLLFECVSAGAREAIGIGSRSRRGAVVDGEGEGERRGGGGERGGGRRQPGELRVGDRADLVLIGKPLSKEGAFYRRRRRVCEVVWDAGPERVTVFGGRVVRVA